jgi:guanylate kinase
MNGKMVIFSAPSGSGKTTIVKHLLGLGMGFEFSVSACSRPMRPGEADGKDYYFLSPEEFQRRIMAGDFVEWEEVYPGRYYGTLRSELDRIWKAGHHVLFDVDVKGGLRLKELFKESALSVFVQAPSLHVLEERLRARSTEDEASFRTRLEKASDEMKFAPSFDIILVNDRLQETLEKAVTIVSNYLNS